MLATVALMAAACASNKVDIAIDDRFSWNVAKVPPNFNGPKIKHNPAETEVLARKGVPDFIRIWWNADGSLIRSSDLSGRRDQVGQILATNKKSWIYMDAEESKEGEGSEDAPKGEEILFRTNGNGYRSQPLSGAMRLVCLYGDPSTRSTPVERGGSTHETWIWIDRGIQVELVDGKPGKERHITATGSGTYLIK